MHRQLVSCTNSQNDAHIPVTRSCYLPCCLSFSCASCGNKTDNQVMFTSMLEGNMKANRQNGCEPRNEPGSDKKHVRILTPIFSAFKMYTHLNILMIVTSVALVEHSCVRLPFTVCCNFGQ